MIQEWNKIKEEQQKKNSKADFATFQPKIVKQWKEMQDEEKNVSCLFSMLLFAKSNFF